MQKKWIAAALACFLMLAPASSFAADYSLDEDYIDVVFGKLSDLDEEQKEKYTSSLKLNMGGEYSLQGLQDNWKEKVSDSQLEELRDLGISDNDVEENIEKLKSWDLDDRIDLIEHAANGNKSAVEALNQKYDGTHSESDRDSDNKKSGGGSGGSGGGSSSQTVEDSTDQVIEVTEETVPQGTLKKSAELSSRGLVSKPIQPIAENKVEAYTDMKTHWSKDYVGYFMDRGIISGRSETAFEPEAAITNAEIITLISRIVVEDPEKVNQGSVATVHFTDVNSTDWYATYANQLAGLGVLQADENGGIQPDEQPSRQKIVKLIMDTIDVLNLEEEESTPSVLMAFNDASNIEPENFNAMQRAVALGLINGMGDGRLAPDEGVTRGQIAVMLKHFNDYVLSKLEEVAS